MALSTRYFYIHGFNSKGSRSAALLSEVLHSEVARLNWSETDSCRVSIKRLVSQLRPFLPAAGQAAASAQYGDDIKKEKVTSAGAKVARDASGAADYPGISAPAVLLGCSMGGFFAYCLALELHLPCALFNPVVDPVVLQSFVGINENFETHERYEFSAELAHSYTGVRPPLPSPSPVPMLVVLGRHDELLDYTLARQSFQNHPGITLRLTEDKHQIADYRPFREDILALSGANLTA